MITEPRRESHNDNRLHRSLGHQTPAESAWKRQSGGERAMGAPLALTEGRGPHVPTSATHGSRKGSPHTFRFPSQN